MPFCDKAMEVSIVSREAIKPSSLPPSLKDNPFKISLLDQITPATYGPSVFFYKSHNHETFQNLSTRLKTSLSQTLSLFYPFSGRVTDNLHVRDFHLGVPFIEARATCPMSHLLDRPSLSSINHLLPCLPFRDETSNPHAPLLAVQLTVFACGGVALGQCMSHKLTDALTCASLLHSWAATARGDPATRHHAPPDFSEASSRFPCLDPLPRLYTSVYENVWFGQSASFKTERFVFGADALAALKKRATSERVPKPSRVQALSGFIWKSAMEASRIASSKRRTRVIAHAVNIRKQPSSIASIGNLFWWALATYREKPAAKGGDELASLVELVNETISEVNSECMKCLQGEEALCVITEYLKQLEIIYANEEPEVYGFTSWVNMGFKDLDFGWGRPVWVGAFGEVGASFRNLTVLTDSANGGGIEAWVTLEEKVLDILKNDDDFLALAVVNPPISTVTASTTN